VDVWSNLVDSNFIDGVTIVIDESNGAVFAIPSVIGLQETFTANNIMNGDTLLILRF